MPNDSNRPDVAVFIDFENVYVSVRDKLDANPNFESIMDRCEDFGRVVIARAGYAVSIVFVHHRR